jgi:ubiquinone biosynthesis protein UbiJ
MGIDLAHALGAILEDTSNRLLRLDSDTLRQLGDLEGKVFCLRVNNTGKGEVGLKMYFFPSEGGFRITQEFAGPADVEITGNPPAFMRLVLGENTPALIGGGQMQITGDLELGQRFQRVLKNIDIDWEEHLSGLVGDIAAHRVARSARKFRGWLSHVASTLRQDVSEILIEESRLTPDRDEVVHFMDGVDQVRAATDRLEKRIDRMMQGKA